MIAVYKSLIVEDKGCGLLQCGGEIENYKNFLRGAVSEERSWRGGWPGGGSAAENVLAPAAVAHVTRQARTPAGRDDAWRTFSPAADTSRVA